VIERLDTAQAFRAARADWDALYARSGVSHLFLTWEWLDAWIAHLSHGFVALLERPRRGAPPRAATIFDAREAHSWAWLTERSYRPGVLAEPGVAHPLRPFLLHAARHLRTACLARSPADAGFRAELDRALGPLRAFVVPRDTIPSHVVATTWSYEAYLASRPSKVRQEIKRKDKKIAAELRGLELVDVAPADVIDVVERVERDSWKAGAATAIISHEDERAFYRTVAALATPRTRARTFALVEPAGPIAFLLGVQHDDVYYALKTSYREDHAALSPGQVLFARLIARFCDHDATVARLELLGMDFALEARAPRVLPPVRARVPGRARARVLRPAPRRRLAVHARGLQALPDKRAALPAIARVDGSARL
jgi:CelD/BcsL family acetyltransferase involved in cellulose biosynthesis